MRESRSSISALIRALDVAGEIASAAATGLGDGAGTIVSPPTLEGGDVGERNEGEKGTGEAGERADDDDDEDVADDTGGAPMDAFSGVHVGPPAASGEGPGDDIATLEVASEREVPAASRAIRAAAPTMEGAAAAPGLKTGGGGGRDADGGT